MVIQIVVAAIAFLLIAVAAHAQMAHNKQAIRDYAAHFQLSPNGEPAIHFSAIGSPFLLCQAYQQIWSLPVISNGAPATLWVRSGLSDKVILVTAAQRNKTVLK